MKLCFERLKVNKTFLYRYRSYRGYNFDAAYTSHAHGWSAGPTSALTFYVLGLTITSPRGKTWAVAPHTGTGLPAAEGGFETPLGWYGVKWSILKNGSLSLQIDAPIGTTGMFKIPRGFGRNMTLNGVPKDFEVVAGDEMPLEGGRSSVVLNPLTPAGQ